MKVGFIDYYLDEWHANNYPQRMAEASGGELTVTCAYALIDSPLPGGRTSAQWSEAMGIPLANSIEEVIRHSDALVVLSPDNCEMHETLCRLPLQSVKPTYVDKTFAPDGQIARTLFGWAQASGTPCFSTSALRYAKEYQDIDAGSLRAISSWGPGDFDTYAIHQMEPVMMLINAPARRVMYLPGDDWYTLCIVFADGRKATLSGFKKGGPFTLNLCGEVENRVVSAQEDFFAPFIERLTAFLLSGEPPVSSEQTIRIMDALGAGRRAMQTPEVWVPV